jgi:hypothetical protein
VKAFLITTAVVFSLIVLAHIARMVLEPSVRSDPWFWLLTLVAAGLSGWAWRLVVRGTRPTP